MAIKKFNAVQGLSVGGDIVLDVVDSNANITATNLTVTSSTNLGNVGNVHITGGQEGQILLTDGTGNLQWVDNIPTSVTYTANSIAQTGGVYVTGDLYSIQVFGDYSDPDGVYVLTDGTGSAPAWYVDIDYLNVTNFNLVTLNINYTQNSGHTIYVQLYNNNTALWDNIGTYTGLGSYYAFALQVIDDVNYINASVSNQVKLRLYHSNGGSAPHTTSIDYAALELTNQGPQGPRGPTGATGNVGPGVASGGTTGQVLTKNSSANYDTTWSSSLALSGTIDVDGDAHVGGNLSVVGNLTFTGNGVINQITGNSGQFFGNAQGIGALYAGLETGYSNVFNPVIQVSADANAYVQVNFQNINHGTQSSTDFCATSDNGNDTQYFIDLGIAGSTWDGTQDNSIGTALLPDDGYLYVQGASGAGNLVLGTATAGTSIKFLAGGPNSANIVAVISNIGANITGILNVSGNANVGNISATTAVFTNISGNGSALSSLTGANITGTVANANYSTYSGTVITAAQPNITSVGTLTSLGVSGAVTAITLVSNVSTGTAPLTVTSTTKVVNLNADLLDGYDTATLATANTIAVRNAAGNLTANYFIGNGSQLTGIDATSIQSGNSNVRVAANGNVTFGVTGVSNVIIVTSTGTNITGTLNVSGNANVGNISGTNGVFTNVSGNGSALSSITGANVTGQVSNALVAGTVYTAAQPNITSVGTLTSVTVSGNATAGNLATGGELNVSGNAVITGNLTVNGSTIYSNVTNMNVKDPIIELGGTGNANPLTLNDGKDRGELLHVFDVAANAQVDKFIGWDNSNAEFAFGSNVTSTNEVITFNAFGNVRASYFFGNGSQLTGIDATSIQNGNSNVRVAANGNVTFGIGGTSNVIIVTSTGANITGTLNVSGNANVGNIGGTNGVFTNVSGNGSALSSITGANVTGAVSFATTANAVAGSNVSGQVSNALVAGTVYTAAQPNITSVGTLTSLGVSGAVTASTLTSNVATGTSPLTVTSTTRVANLNVAYANVADFINVSTGTTGNVYPVFANAITGNVTEYANSTFVANLSNGSFTATTFVGSLSGVATSATTATTASTVTTNAQPNITSVGTLTSLSVNGTVTAVAFTANTGVFTGNGNGLSSIVGANVTGTVASANNAAYLGGTIASNYLLVTGTGSSLTAITGANVTGTVANATYAVSAGTATSATTAGTVTTAAQPNITSVGTLTTLAVTGNISAANITATHYGAATGLTSIPGANVTGTVANATYAVSAGSATTATSATTAGTVTTNAQPNITSTGTLTSLTVTGNVATGNVSGTSVVVGTYSELTGSTATTTSTTQTAIASFSAITYGAAKFVVQATEGTNRHVTELLVTHDGVNTFITEYGIIKTNTSVFDLSADITTGNVRLLAISATANSTVYRVSTNLIKL